MARTVGIGKQDFEKVRINDNFYVDKTDFIRQWWEADDDVTLITRPRRFWQDSEYEHGGKILFHRIFRPGRAVLGASNLG